MSMMHLDPALLAGWEPRTPLSDSVVRRFLENWVIGFEALARPLAARTLRRDDLSAVDVARPAFIVNSAMLHAPLFPDRVDDIAATLDDFYGLTTGEGTGRVYLWSPWPTADLRAHGWTLADPTRPAMLIASDQGRPVYERMGYLPLFRFTLWSRTREGNA